MNILLTMDEIKKYVNEYDEYVVFDIETTGLSCKNGDKLIEISAVKIKNNKIVDTFSSLINPYVKLPKIITDLTGITDNDLINQPSYEEVLPKFIEFIENLMLVAHNATFDMGFIAYFCEKLGIPFPNRAIDTLLLSRTLLPHMPKHKLDMVAKELNVVMKRHHRAMSDVEATAEIFIIFIEKLIIKKEINFVIKSIVYWKGSEERIYINTSIGTVYISIPRKGWIVKDNKPFPLNEIKKEVFKKLNITTCKELYEFKGKYYA